MFGIINSMNTEVHIVNLFGKSDPGFLVIITTKSVTIDSWPTIMFELGLKMEKYFKFLANIRLNIAQIKHNIIVIFI